MTYTLKRVNVSSIFKAGLVINIALFLVIGLFTIVMPMLFFGSFSRMMVVSSDPDLQALSQLFGTAGLLSGLCFLFVFVIVGSVIAALYYALIAWIYNLTSGWIGGVKITLQDSDDDFYAEIDADLKRKNN